MANEFKAGAVVEVGTEGTESYDYGRVLDVGEFDCLVAWHLSDVNTWIMASQLRPWHGIG